MDDYKVQNDYKFQLVSYEAGQLQDKTVLNNRPFMKFDMTFEKDAKKFIAGEELDTAINTAIAVGEPLLITGEAGTGKTQTAYYTAYKLGIEPVIHFQVKSETTANDLLYHFDAVRYFHEANIKKDTTLKKSSFIEPRALWQAMKSDHTRVLLIDEIDKASRDFPNDLLHELDKMEFTIPETNEKIKPLNNKNRPIVFITSNSERRLPEPFLRRCIYHHIEFSKEILEKAIKSRKDEFKQLSDSFINMALQRFLKLREKNLRKIPSSGEFIVWLRVLSMTAGIHHEKLEENLSTLPYLGVLLKDHQDINDLRRQ